MNKDDIGEDFGTVEDEEILEDEQDILASGSNQKIEIIQVEAKDEKRIKTAEKIEKQLKEINPGYSQGKTEKKELT